MKAVRPLRCLTRSLKVGSSVSQVPPATALQLGAFRCSGGGFAMRPGPARPMSRGASPQTRGEAPTSLPVAVLIHASLRRSRTDCRSVLRGPCASRRRCSSPFEPQASQEPATRGGHMHSLGRSVLGAHLVTWMPTPGDANLQWLAADGWDGLWRCA